jgi:hypothetical protein
MDGELGSELGPVGSERHRMQRDLWPVTLTVAGATHGNLFRRGVGLAQRFEALVPLATLDIVRGGVPNRRHTGVPQDIRPARARFGW